MEILRVGGATEEHHVGKHILIDWITRIIGAPGALDTVNLRDGRVMLVDDTGLVDGRPRNAAATALYAAVCYERTGRELPPEAFIAGDVAVAVDEDFA